MNKILFVKSGDISVLWTDSEEGMIQPGWWIDTKFPEEKGIYVWERDVGVRKPSNKEWWKMIAGLNPVEPSEDPCAVLGEWVASPNKKAV